MAVTLHTIAKKAGVSAPVVSAVVNNNYKNCRVSPEKRKRIEKLIEELNYMPNTTARNLVKKETRTINIVIPSVGFFAQSINNRFVMGVQDSIEEKGYRLTFTSLNRDYRDYRGLNDSNADAILTFIWGERHEYVVHKLRKFDKPVMVAFARCSVPGVHNLYFDNETPMYRLTKEVIARGHTKIVYAEAFAGDYFHKQAWQGAEKAFAETGIDCHHIKLNVDDFDYYNGDECTFNMGQGVADTMREEVPGATALMCSHDTLAMGAIQRFRELNLNVPEDISVTGADSHGLSGCTQPPLTTLTKKGLEAGRRAGNLLIEILEGKHPGPVVEKVMNEPVLRGSIKDLNGKK